MRPLQSFELFPELPSEIRELIWQAALPSTRVVPIELHPIEPEDEFDEREQLLYEEDLYGTNVENEDTRSVPEKDMRLLVHRTSQDLDRVVKRQSQLLKYGFTSSKPAPNISHASFHDLAAYRGFGEYEPNPKPASRDVRLLLHIRDYFHMWRQDLNQAQLHRYGFKTSRPRPTIRHVSHQELYSAQEPIQFYSTTPLPALLHVCRESRQQAIRSGYVLAFSTRWAPAQTWFNLKTDFLYLNSYEYMENRPEFHELDRQRISRLALDFYRGDFPGRELHGDEFPPVKYFGNLEELVIIMRDTDPNPDDDCLLVDCTIAEVLEGTSSWCPYNIESRQVKSYTEAHPNGPSFYDRLIGNLEAYITRQLESLIQQGKPGFKIPKIRFVNLTDAQGKRDLEAIRAQYWGKREELPSKGDWERFMKEDMDARMVARPPSPFDIQYADDLEVDYEIFREGLMQFLSELEYGYVLNLLQR
jgi:hypothetical protein